MLTNLLKQNCSVAGVAWSRVHMNLNCLYAVGSDRTEDMDIYVSFLPICVVL
jgi:hypothetical protein